MNVRGGCVCGKVRYEIQMDSLADLFLYQCHCGVCRKAFGGTGLAAIVTPGDGFRWLQGEEARRWFERPSSWRRAFCVECGSPTPMGDDLGRTFWVPAGGLDECDGLRVGAHIYLGSCASWDIVADDGALRFEEGME